MIKIRDYATSAGISYEAVRKQLKRYSADLDGHIHQQGRTQYLDDVAVSFLDAHRAQNPLVVYDSGTDARLLDLEAENRELNQKLLALYEDNKVLHERIAQYHALEIESTKTTLALEAATEKQQAIATELSASRQETAAERARADELQRALAESEAREEALKRRSLLKRILNK